MNFACVVKLKERPPAWIEDVFLDKRLQECARADAAIVKQSVAEHMARKRFGPDWQASVVIEEIPYNEWMAHISALKKGRGMTEAQRRQLNDMHAERWQYRVFKARLQGEMFYVNARSAREAVELLGSKWTVHPRTFWRHSEVMKSTPLCMEGRDMSKPMAFVRTKKRDWRRIK